MAGFYKKIKTALSVTSFGSMHASPKANHYYRSRTYQPRAVKNCNNTIYLLKPLIKKDPIKLMKSLERETRFELATFSLEG